VTRKCAPGLTLNPVPNMVAGASLTDVRAPIPKDETRVISRPTLAAICRPMCKATTGAIARMICEPVRRPTRLANDAV
jgi:hypothetical protein